MTRTAVVLVNLSGRGDKDVLSVQQARAQATGGR
jgi:tryptophan synthase beta subunit